MAKFQPASIKNFLLADSRGLWSRARSMKQVVRRRVQIWTSFASQFKMAMQLSCHCLMIAIEIEFPAQPPPNKRLQRTRRDAPSLVSCVGEPLKRNVRRLGVRR